MLRILQFHCHFKQLHFVILNTKGYIFRTKDMMEEKYLFLSFLQFLKEKIEIEIEHIQFTDLWPCVRDNF